MPTFENVIKDHITLNKHSINVIRRTFVQNFEGTLPECYPKFCERSLLDGKKAFVGPHENEHHISCVARDASVSCR